MIDRDPVPSAAAPLDPARHPVLLFDGVCNLCNATVRFVIARDAAARFRFAPLQSEVGRTLLVRHGLDPGALDAVVLVDADGAHDRSTAALRVARALGLPWRWLGGLGLLVPRAVRDAVYDFVARHRYRWFGREAACPVPTAEQRARFLA